MYNVLIEGVDVLSAFLQGWLLSLLMSGFMVTKLKNRRGSRFYIVIFWVLLRLGGHLWSNDNYDHMIPMLKQITIWALLLLFVTALYEGRGLLRFYLTVVFMAFSEISFFLAYMIIVFGKHLFDLYSWYVNRGYMPGGSTEGFLEIVNITAFLLQALVYVVFLLLLFLCIRVFLKKYREKDYAVQKTEMLFLLVPALTGFLTCVLLRMIIIVMENGIPVLLYDRYRLLTAIVPAILLLALASILCSVQLLQDMISLNREKNSRVAMEQQVRGMRAYIQEMNRTQAGIRAMRHDMKNQLAVMHGLIRRVRQGDGDSRELEDYLETLEQTAESLEMDFHTGNVVADAILSLKCHEAAERLPGVEIDAETLTFPGDLKIENYDITVILCNALDNAIEACEKLERAERKIIRLTSFRRGKLFFFRIENSFHGQLIHKEGLEFPSTDKSDKGLHGIGFLNMKASVRKYCGAVDWEAENGMFYLTVMMKNNSLDRSVTPGETN